MRMLLNGIDASITNKINTIEDLVRNMSNIIGELKGNVVSIKNTTDSIIPDNINKIRLVEEKLAKLSVLETNLKGVTDKLKTLSDSIVNIDNSATQKIIPEINKVITSLNNLSNEIKSKYALKTDLDKKQNLQITLEKELTVNDKTVQLKHSINKTYGIDLRINVQCYGGTSYQRVLKEENKNDKLEIGSNECGKFQIYSIDSNNLGIMYFDFPISRSKIVASLSGFSDGVLDIYFQPKE